MNLRPPRRMPAAEVAIDRHLVHQLLRQQHPDLADLPLRKQTHGWDNDLFRLGEDLCVRLPRRAAAAELIVHEQRWLPGLAATLPLAIPAPIRSGSAASGYPWSWSICPWFPGSPAATEPPRSAAHTVRQLARFLRALHQHAPDVAPRNAVRGGPLGTRRAPLLEQLPHVDCQAVAGCTAAELERLWNELEATPPWRSEPVWLHGDLHLFNLLVDQGELSAVIDFGDLTSGDPATDLAVAWMLWDAPERAAFRQQVQADDDTWQRACGWALAFAVVYLAHAADQPELGRLGARMLRQIVRARLR